MHPYLPKSLVIACLLAFTQPVHAGLLLDLQTATGGKSATVAHVGDVVTLNVYANVTGANATTLDDGIANAFFSIESNSSSGLNGNLSLVSLESDFSATSSSGGNVADLNGDGNLDVGSTNDFSATGWVFVRDSQMNLFTLEGVHQVLLGSLTYTVTSGAAYPNSATINIVGRTRVSAAVLPTDWTEDGTEKITDMGNTIPIGSPVTIVVAPEPASLSLLGPAACLLIIHTRRKEKS